MCGIAGIIATGEGAPNVRIQRMIDAVSHRGPDGHGVFADDLVALGHRRLSIVDLSDAGTQPMSSASCRLVITYNGEIYNHLELRAELESLGFLFRSHSDTEVILVAYEAWGEQCVNRFNGMWAFAIWDRHARTLFCSRDRFGVKPFYFFAEGEGLAFGSEIRQLLLMKDRARAVKQRIEEFLLTGMSDHTDGTFFEGICKLPAGHNLIWSEGRPRVEIQRYYRLERRPEFSSLGESQAIESYGALLQDAVRLRLRSDVPVATCLSGGLDSSSVAALAASAFYRNTGQNFIAITAVSEQTDNSEEAFAQQVVEASRLRWCRVKPNLDDLRSQLDSVVTTQEEPFGSTSIVMQHAVMRKARAEGIPVLLDGQGGDETLLGYKKYVAAYMASQWREGGWSGIWDALNSAGRNNASWSLGRVAMYLAGSRFAGTRYAYHRWEHRYLRDAPPLPEHLSAFSDACFDDFELQRLEIERTSLPALLRYEDKNSMAHSVEARLPFLDYRLVELALSLPGRYKIREGWSKWVLRRAMVDRLPANVVWRRDKMGFEAPERTWQSGLRSEMVAEVLQSPLLQDLIDRRRLASRFEHLPLRAQWRLYSVALWAKSFGIGGWGVESGVDARA